MNPAEIIECAAADGVDLSLSPAGKVNAAGDQSAVSRWLPAIREHKPAIISALMRAANEVSSWRWLLHYPKSDPVEASFSPVATREEVLRQFPGTVGADPIQDLPKRKPIDAEVKELQALVATIYQGDTEADRAEALAAALADPDIALLCYRAIAGTPSLVIATGADDRRCCIQCRNLRGGVCSVARAEADALVVANRRYRPVSDLRRRCEGFRPDDDDPDQRPGSQRWPGLNLNVEGKQNETDDSKTQ